MYDLLKIENPQFLKELNRDELKTLCQDIRAFLLANVSKSGGHLASNLGVVELTVGLHYIFDLLKDDLIFDVGHQAYTHKILTGRAKFFSSFREMNSISGFVDCDESPYDKWESGHSSTSLSASLGFLLSYKRHHKNNRVITLIGDASLANGISLSALNLFSEYKDLNPLIILNDNGMGISETVGKIHNNSKEENERFFDSLGFHYVGPIDGNNVGIVIDTLNAYKDAKYPVLIHAKTIKGYGYLPAMLDKEKYHGLGRFDLETGEIIASDKLSIDKIITKKLILWRKNHDYMIINPAMISSQELNEFKEMFKDDIIDVGINEENAVLIAASLALQKEKVLVFLYSTFMQRAYDEMLNDVSRQNLNVFFFIDRAGIAFKDGKTHQGIYDLSMLRSMPNMVIMSASSVSELKGLITFGLQYDKGPIAIRYPKMDLYDEEEMTISNMNWVIEKEGNKAIIISYGFDLQRILNLNLDAYIINARFLRPLDKEMLNYIAKLNLPILIYETVIESSSLMEAILAYYHKHDIRVNKLRAMNIDNNQVITHGDESQVLEKYHLSDRDIISCFEELICD